MCEMNFVILLLVVWQLLAYMITLLIKIKLITRKIAVIEDTHVNCN